MKKDKEEALRWLKQSEHNLEVAKSNFAEGFYSDACFMSEQASQAGLKSFIIFKTKRPLWKVHSIQALAKESMKYNKEFKEFVDYGRILDRYFIPTRYPDALNYPAVPYETYTKNDAKEAINFAEKIIKEVKKEIGKEGIKL